MKATSLFGGVQIFQIIIQVVRSKFIAILLGPTGMGIAGLLISTVNLISGLTNFGLKTSAVKDVSSANASGNEIRVATVITVLRRLVWITGTLGAVITLMFSSCLSRLTFGNSEFTLAFILISITLLFKQITVGQIVLLQGLRKHKYLAQANLYGSFFGLIITVPLYYFWGIDAIVPGMIVTATISLIFSRHFSRKVKIQKVNVSKFKTIAVGKDMLTMGFMISLSGIFTLGAAYVVRVFITNRGGLVEVGLYNAGFAIINTYVGLLFTSMGTDYYPRLSAVAHSNKLCRKTINQQAEIAILILAPLLIIFLVYIKWIVIILYSKEFTPIDTMIHWAALGMLFKAASWSIGFILLAKGASKHFLFNELLANIYILGLNLLGYYFWGLSGLGISFMIGYFLYLIQILTFSNIKYNFSFNSSFLYVFLIQFGLAIFCFLIIKLVPSPYSYLVGSFLIVLSALYSIKELDKRLDIRSLIKSFTKRS